MSITGAQIKAARALIDWGQDDLAEAAGLSVKTVGALENGARSPRSLRAAEAALDGAGVDFIGETGVKRRDHEVRSLRGRPSTLQFADLLNNEVRRTGSEITFVGRSLDLLARTIGNKRFADGVAARFLASLGPVRCIVAEPPTPAAYAAFWSGLSCRLTNDNEIGPSPYIIFGNHIAELFTEANGEVWFLLINSPSSATQFRRHFLGVWNSAVALAGPQLAPKARRITRIASVVAPAPTNKAQVTIKA